jgi:hypothetical protein
MLSRETKQYNDAKKSSDSFNRSDVGKKHQTHEDRCNYYDRFLRFYDKGERPQVEEKSQLEVLTHEKSRTSLVPDWAGQVRDKVSRMVSFLWEKKSALLLGAMLASAGGLGVAEGRSLRNSTALRHLDSSNATGLPPALGWEGFNHPSNQTARSEVDPSRITPEFLHHLKENLGVSDPERFIQKAFKQNERRHLTEQESNEPKRRKLDEVCLQWLEGTKAISLGATPIEVNGVTGQAFAAEYDLQVDNMCGETVNNVFFTVTQEYACTTGCQPAGGGLGEKMTAVAGNPSTIENGQLSQGQAFSYVYCEQVDSNGQATELVPPATITVTAMAYGADSQGAVVSPQEPLLHL